MANKLSIKVPVGTKARIAAISGAMGIFPQDAKKGQEVSLNLNGLASLSDKNLKALSRIDGQYFWAKYRCVASAEEQKDKGEKPFVWIPDKSKPSETQKLWFPLWEADKTSDYAELEEDSSLPQPILTGSNVTMAQSGNS